MRHEKTPGTIQKSMNCSSDLKNFANSWPLASNFSRSVEQFHLTVGQNNFGNKIPFINSMYHVFLSLQYIFAQIKLKKKILWSLLLYKATTDEKCHIIFNAC